MTNCVGVLVSRNMNFWRAIIFVFSQLLCTNCVCQIAHGAGVMTRVSVCRINTSHKSLESD